MIDALPFRRPNQNYRILGTQTGETSIHISLYLPSHYISTLRQYLLVTIESSLTDLLSFGLRFGSIKLKLARPDESTPHGGFLVSAWTFFRSLSPSRTHSVSRTGNWIRYVFKQNSCHPCLKYCTYIHIIRLFYQCSWRLRWSSHGV